MSFRYTPSSASRSSSPRPYTASKSSIWHCPSHPITQCYYLSVRHLQSSSMCHQITYTWPCEHVRKHVQYCAHAPDVPKQSQKQSSCSNSSTKDKDAAAAASASPPQRPHCGSLSHQSLAYPPPPSFDGQPMAGGWSKCPLPTCPFEARNRCWNCCWCGKQWNVEGRCSCVMIIEGSYFKCDHICCPSCQPAQIVAEVGETM